MPLLVAPKCPACGRLTVDNPQHCPEKKAALWATNCQWLVCAGTITDPAGKRVKCSQVYGPTGWAGFGRAS